MKNRRNNPRRGAPRRSPAQTVATLYEDESIFALDKPAGLVAVPIPGSSTPSALSIVREHLKTIGEKALIVHRIDRFTSGILLFAKTERDRAVLVDQFLEHTPRREYLAVVRGELEDDEGTLQHYFRREGQHQELSSRRDRNATLAELDYMVERRLRGATLVRVGLRTGLQNQIRVQFSAEGHPVIGDRKYHPREADEKRINRVALHATYLEFEHPRTGKVVKIESKPPADFRALLKSLGAAN